MRERDLAWEALVRETAANEAMERGQLNVALKAIRSAALSEGLMDEGLPEEIRLRAQAYRRTFPGLVLTPTALAKHWHRVMVVPASGSDELQRSHDVAQQAIDRARGL